MDEARPRLHQRGNEESGREPESEVHAGVTEVMHRVRIDIRQTMNEL